MSTSSINAARSRHIRIRPMSVDDFLAVAALDRRAWRRNRNGEFIPDGEHVWRTWCECALSFVADDRGTVVGAAVAFPCCDGRYVVHKVFVEESFHAGGVGARLLEAVLAALDQWGVEAFLTVDPANEAAIRLYERLGFTRREFIKGYYRPNEDRFVLTRPWGAQGKE